MVVKTELCAFSEFRIYPGHGVRLIRKDGQPINLSTSKAKSLNKQRKKPALLHWTLAWRRLNKKGKEEGVAKKKARRTIKIQRAIVGATLEDLHKRKTAPRTKVNAATEAALKEVKARSAAKTAGPKGGAAAGKPVIPKIQRSNANARGSTTR